jgi:SAM-dependent methyltransferase
MSFDKSITLDDFCRSLDCPRHRLPSGVEEKYGVVNTRYRSISLRDSEDYVLDILSHIASPVLRRSREENLKKWEDGWNENFMVFKDDLSEESLKPKYFHPNRFFRYDKTIIVPENNNIEYDLFAVIRYYIFQQYFYAYDSIYELGCGSCQNIFALSRLFPEKDIVGLDWTKASKDIADRIGQTINANVKGVHFDLMEPADDTRINGNSVVFSIHALEQVGMHFDKLLSFLLKKRPALVFHYEPIVEVFDRSNVYDCLALMYCEKRDYLRGYLTAIRNLAKCGKIEIIKELRPCIGGVYHDSSFIVWRPI